MRRMLDPETAKANRERFRSLLREHGLTQAESASRIAAHTGVPCSYRTVKAWLADPAVKTALPCPTWAVEALREACKPPQHT